MPFTLVWTPSFIRTAKKFLARRLIPSESEIILLDVGSHDEVYG